MYFKLTKKFKLTHWTKIHFGTRAHMLSISCTYNSIEICVHCSVGGDVPVDSEAPVVTSSISRPDRRLCHSEVLIGVGCACVRS